MRRRYRLLLNPAGRKGWCPGTRGVLHTVMCCYAERAARLRLVCVFASDAGEVRAWADAQGYALCDFCIGSTGRPRGEGIYEAIFERRPSAGL